jgi:hypothetical protein
MSLPVEAPVGHGANANAKCLQLGHGVQDQPGLAPEPAVVEDLAAFRPALEGDGAGNAAVGADAVVGQVVQLTVPFSELDLRPDGQALSLLLGADAGVNGARIQPSNVSATRAGREEQPDSTAIKKVQETVKIISVPCQPAQVRHDDRAPGPALAAAESANRSGRLALRADSPLSSKTGTRSIRPASARPDEEGISLIWESVGACPSLQ